MKLRELLQQKGIRQQELAKSVGLDEPMISKFMNYKCLPIPPDMKLICEFLNCAITDIYLENEIYMKEHKESSVSKEPEWYNLTVRLPRNAKDLLNKANLKKCGYKDITQWITRCYERLEKRINKINQKEKDRTDAGTSVTATKGIK